VKRDTKVRLRPQVYGQDVVEVADWISKRAHPEHTGGRPPNATPGAGASDLLRDFVS